MKKLLYVLPLLLLVGLGAVFFLSIGKNPQELPSVQIGQAVPSRALPQLIFNAEPLVSTETFSLKNYLGKPFLLNLWATWCAECLIEHPVLLNLQSQGIVIVGLNYRDEPLRARSFLEVKGNPFAQVLLDSKGQMGVDLGAYGAPETYFVDANGILKYRHVGAITPEVWQQKLQPIWQQLQQDASR